MSAVAKKRQRRSVAMRVRRAPQIRVREYKDVHVTPPSAIVHPKFIEYRSGDYREVAGKKFSGVTLTEIASGFKITVHQTSRPLKGTAAMSGHEEVVPGMCNVWASGGHGETDLEVEGWRVSVAELEHFARALLEVVEKGRGDGIFT